LSQNYDPAGPSFLPGKGQSPGRCQVSLLHCSITQNNGQSAGFQGLFDSPENRHGLAQADTQKALPRQPHLLNAIAMAAAIFPHLSFESTP
jgi:hypothetical protein